MVAEFTLPVDQLIEEKDYWQQEAARLRESHDKLIDFMSTASDLLYETNATCA